MRKRRRSKSGYEDDDEWYLELPKIDVFEKEYEEDFEEETGLFFPDGRPILRRCVRPKKNPVGFIWIEDDADE